MTLPSNVNWRYWSLIGRLVLLGIIPLILLCLPANYFDHGRPMCLSVLLLNQECYGCGMTRAIMHLIHLDWEEALYYNPLAFVVFPLLAFVWLRWAIQAWKQLQGVIKDGK